MDRNARDFEDLARGKKQYDTDGQPTGHINLFRNDANSTRWIGAGGTADVKSGTEDPTGFSETTFLSSNYALLHRINSKYAPTDFSRSRGLLGTGGYFNSLKEREKQAELQRKCINSNSCAAGYSCISGQCTKIWGKDPSNVDSCGDLSVSWPCASKDDPGTSKCGNNNGPGSCQEQICGTGIDSRCCRAGKDGDVFCFCRACGDEGQCDPFCDAYNKTHGKAGPGCTPAGGVEAGFCNKDICSECQECIGSIFGGGKKCEKKTSGAPCWCEGERNQCNPDDCDKCNKDKDSSNYGKCEYSWEDCADCCTIYNFQCPNCNKYIDQVRHCEPHTDPNFASIRRPCYEGARRLALERCESECKKPEPDPCAPKCSTSTYCSDTHPGVTECPEGSTLTGTMTVGANTCIFCENCDNSSISPECCKPTCNCHADCGQCEKCGTDGECYADPMCQTVEASCGDFVGNDFCICRICYTAPVSGKFVCSGGIDDSDNHLYSVQKLTTVRRRFMMMNDIHPAEYIEFWLNGRDPLTESEDEQFFIKPGTDWYLVPVDSDDPACQCEVTFQPSDFSGSNYPNIDY